MRVRGRFRGKFFRWTVETLTAIVEWISMGKYVACLVTQRGQKKDVLACPRQVVHKVAEGHVPGQMRCILPLP